MLLPCTTDSVSLMLPVMWLCESIGAHVFLQWQTSVPKLFSELAGHAPLLRPKTCPDPTQDGEAGEVLLQVGGGGCRAPRRRLGGCLPSRSWRPGRMQRRCCTHQHSGGTQVLNHLESTLMSIVVFELRGCNSSCRVALPLQRLSVCRVADASGEWR